MKSFVFLTATAAALSLAACGGPYALTTQEKMVADNGALSYFQSEGGQANPCSPSDSDSDGYVTCEGIGKDGKAVALLCSYKGAQSGCKRK